MHALRTAGGHSTDRSESSHSALPNSGSESRASHQSRPQLHGHVDTCFVFTRGSMHIHVCVFACIACAVRAERRRVGGAAGRRSGTLIGLCALRCVAYVCVAVHCVAAKRHARAAMFVLCCVTYVLSCGALRSYSVSCAAILALGLSCGPARAPVTHAGRRHGRWRLR